MKKFRMSIVILAAAALLVAACSPQTQTTGQSLPETTVTSVAEQPGTTGGNVTAQGTLNSLSSMVGQEVKSATGQSIGDIAGVVVSMANNAGVSVPQVEYVVVNAGPGMNVGDKALYIPVSAFQSSQGGSNFLTVNVDPTVLAQAPSFDVSSLPNVSAANWDQEIANFWANQGMSLPVTGGVDASSARVMLTNALQDLNVTGANGDIVGQVKDFLIDPQTGQVRYAIIAAGTELGNKFLPIPLSAINWQIDPNAAQSLGQMALTVDPAVLQNAPSFVDMNAINSVLSTWGPQVETFWNSLSK